MVQLPEPDKYLVQRFQEPLQEVAHVARPVQGWQSTRWSCATQAAGGGNKAESKVRRRKRERPVCRGGCLSKAGRFRRENQRRNASVVFSPQLQKWLERWIKIKEDVRSVWPSVASP